MQILKIISRIPYIKTGINFWVLGLFLALIINNECLPWFSVVYHADTYKKMEIKLDSVKFRDSKKRYVFNPKGYSDSFPNKAVRLYRRECKARINYHIDTFDDRPMPTIITCIAWHSPQTNKMYQVRENEEVFPRNKFIRYIFLIAFPLMLIVLWILLSFYYHWMSDEETTS